MVKRSILMILIGFGIALIQATPTMACSGGGAPWDERLPKLIESSEIIVVGQYEEFDDTEANGIFHVETYLKGIGSEFLVIQASELATIENRQNVHRNYPCGINSPHRLSHNGKYIYFLTPQLNGSYKIHESKIFVDEQDTIIVYAGNYENREVVIADIIDSIIDIVGFEPQAPNLENIYPRVTPILLTTKDGHYFLLPVDSNEPIEIPSDTVLELRRDQYQCDNPPCTVFSPNGMDRVNLVASANNLSYYELFPIFISSVQGQRIIFSSTSDTFALWNDDQIEIYSLWYPSYRYINAITGSYSPKVVNSIVAHNSLEFPVAWHPDGRLVAFSTDEGLWLWDALTADSEPQLLIPTEDDVPIVRYFSPQGRYIAISEGKHHYNFDLISHQQLPDGYVSPDDRTLLVFDTQSELPTTLEVMYLAPGVQSFELYSMVKYIDIQWIDSTSFITSVTGFSYLDFEMGEPNLDENGEIMGYEAIPFVVEETFFDVMKYYSSGYFQSGFGSNNQVPYSIQDLQTNSFTYDPNLGLIEISVDGYFIMIDGRQIWYKSPLSAPIVEATWLPSIFYFED